MLAGNERHASVELVAHLAALHERPSLYEGLGFGSLFEYCTAVLRLSEDATCTRTAVAGACRRFPVILELLATGATNLTNIRRLAGRLTPENHEAILARAVRKTREEIHHVQPFAQQGPATAENISLRCRAHNVYESELVFGRFDPSVPAGDARD